MNEKGTSKALGNFRVNMIAACIVATQFVQMIPYGAAIGSSISIGTSMGASPLESTWLAASYPLTQGAFLMIGGRLGAVYGHKNAVAAAGIWWVIFHVVSGFVRNFIAHCVVRALAGIGGAFMVPNAIALLTILLPPGLKRNIAVGLFGAMAPIGAAGGGNIPGIFVQLTDWKWMYFFLALLGAVVFGTFIFVVPSEPEPLDKDGKVDYVGAALGVSALILFNFVWNQAPLVGWDTEYVYILLIVSILCFGAFCIWEWKGASEPILPLSIFKAPTFTPMLIAAFFTFMAVGIIIWYVSVIQLEIRNYSIPVNGATYATLAVSGACVAVLSAFAVRVIPAQFILIIGGVASATALTLVATTPAHQTFWAQIFPALILTAFGPDFVFTASQIIASNAVKKAEQGIAGSLIGSLLSYGLSTGLGFAGTVDAYTNDKGRNPLQGHRNGLWLGVGMAGTAAVIAAIFVRIPKDTKEGWDEDEDEVNQAGREEKQQPAA